MKTGLFTLNGFYSFVVALSLFSIPTMAQDSGDFDTEIEHLQEEINRLFQVSFFQENNCNEESDSKCLSKSDYKDFLSDFSKRAQQRKIGRRFFPLPISIGIVKQNSLNCVASNTLNCLSQNRLPKRKGMGQNNFTADHKSTEKLLDFIIAKFPEIGSAEAHALATKNLNTRKQIMERVKAFEEIGINVKSCPFSVAYCQLNDETDIAFFTQDLLLSRLNETFQKKDQLKKGELSIE